MSIQAPSTIKRPETASAVSYESTGNQLTAVYGGMSSAVAREVAQVQGQIMMAKAYPRNMDLVLAKVESACSRKTLAEHALYTYARGGSNISGPTIRLMEALAAAYGNIKAGYEVVEADDEKSRIRAYAYDMETNTVIERNFDVEHVRYSDKVKKKLIDPRDIYEVIANNASRRVRACLQQIIPGDIVDYAVGLAKKTLVENVDTSPAARASLVDAFSKFGVTKIMLEAYIQRKMDAITADQIVNLRGVYASLRDGIATITDFFDPDAKPIGDSESTAPAVADKKSSSARKTAARTQQKAESAPQPQPDPAPQQEPAITPEGEILEDSGVSEAFDNAAGPEEFDDDPELY